MKRRDFLCGIGIVSTNLGVTFPEPVMAEDAGSNLWRKFEVTTLIEVLKPSGATRIWVPAALITGTPYQKTVANTFQSGSGTAKMIERKIDGLGIMAAEFPPGMKPRITVTSTVMTRNWAVDLAARRQSPESNRSQLEHWLRPTKLLPTDGIVKQRAIEITKSARTDLDKARAIYEWIVENTYRNPKTRGCGRGNIRFMLESGDLGGKCADLNALYVGLARAAGLPARDVYGIRVGSSRTGYKSLGTSSENVTKSQHCRAEVYLNEHGWVPVDPADVRKVMLEEPPGNRPLDDEMVKHARARLFGSWEMNWMAYNFAHDVALPGSRSPAIGFFMYPQAETGEGRLDSLEPDSFRYEVTAREIAGTTPDPALFLAPKKP
jgi:transglutaminase-like putative cysteine protease